MNRSFLFVAVALMTIVSLEGCAESPGPDPRSEVETTTSLTAAVVPLEGWRIDGEPQVIVGDALFELINGGAELYHQHGFVQVLAAEYSDDAGRDISLEVFEMKDLQGAQDVFAEKSGGSGEPLAIGDEAAFDDYYLNARTGPYLITITGFETDEATTGAIRRLAESVVSALGESS